MHRRQVNTRKHKTELAYIGRAPFKLTVKRSSHVSELDSSFRFFFMERQGLEDRLRRMMCPELEPEIVGVTAAEWAELEDSEIESGADEARRQLNSTVSRVLDAARSYQMREDLEKSRRAKNLRVFKCTSCGNAVPGNFLEVEGSIICQGTDARGCGLELVNNKPHEGNFYRSFEGEDDRSHHGKGFDPLFSEAWNSRMGSTIENVKNAGKLKAVMQKVEEDQSSTTREVDDRSTREAYKDKHKNQAFAIMSDTVANLSLHARVLERAKYIFAKFREDRDKVQKQNLVLAACLVAALRESEKLSLAEEPEEARPSLTTADPAVLAEREQHMMAERRKRLADIEQGNAKRKRERESEVAEVSAAPYVPMAKWDDAKVRQWLAGAAASAVQPDTLAAWELKARGGGGAATAAHEGGQPAWLDAFMQRLLAPGKTPGQCLVLANTFKYGLKSLGACSLSLSLSILFLPMKPEGSTLLLPHFPISTFSGLWLAVEAMRPWAASFTSS
jgi:hypothetical protein